MTVGTDVRQADADASWRRQRADRGLRAWQSGMAAERSVAACYDRRGADLLETRWRGEGGEIDLIMRDAETLVFIEVRYRANSRFGSALESVTHTKQRRLITAARFYLAQHGLSCSCRFDVVGVEGTSPRSIHWIRHAFEAF